MTDRVNLVLNDIRPGNSYNVYSYNSGARTGQMVCLKLIEYAFRLNSQGFADS